MYVQITKHIVQILDYLTDNFDIEVSTGKNDIVNLRVFFPKVEMELIEIADVVVTLIERFGVKQELHHGKPIVWDRDGFYIHFFIIKSERIKT